MKGLETFYPGKGDPPGEPLLYRGSNVEVKVGNVPTTVWSKMDMPMDGVPRSATKVLAGVAIGEDGEVVGWVLLPQGTAATGSAYGIDWGARLATARQLFEEQNSNTESIA